MYNSQGNLFITLKIKLALAPLLYFSENSSLSLALYKVCLKHL